MCVHDFLRPGFAVVPRLFASLLLVSCSLGGGHALAQSSASPGAPSDVLEQRRQLERIDLLRRQQERGLAGNYRASMTIKEMHREDVVRLKR
jgi:hypothetical protein